MQNIKFLSWGIIAALGALFVELTFNVFFSPTEQTLSPGNFHLTFLLVAYVLIEELFKFLFIRRASREFKNSLDFLSGSLLIGAGFTLMELILIYFNPALLQDVSWLAIAGVLVIHLSTSLFFGYALFARRHFLLPAVLVGASGAHLLYNILVLQEVSALTGYLYLLVLCAVAFLCIHSLYRQRLSR